MRVELNLIDIKVTGCRCTSITDVMTCRPDSRAEIRVGRIVKKGNHLYDARPRLSPLVLVISSDCVWTSLPGLVFLRKHGTVPRM